jgi:hypothetical protein
MNFEGVRALQGSRADLDLDEFQRGQAHHDSACHADVLALPIQDRLKHFVLHFAKYVGGLVELQASTESSLRQRRLLTDAFIICLAMANCLNLRLSARIAVGPDGHTHDSVSVTRSLAIITGRMAKACEAMDHVERFDIRGELEKNVLEIAALVLNAANVFSIDLGLEVAERWSGVAKKMGL